MGETRWGGEKKNSKKGGSDGVKVFPGIQSVLGRKQKNENKSWKKKATKGKKGNLDRRRRKNRRKHGQKKSERKAKKKKNGLEKGRA